MQDTSDQAVATDIDANDDFDVARMLRSAAAYDEAEQRVSRARVEAERQLREENNGEKPHGNAINARVKDILLHAALVADNPDISTDEWNALFRREQLNRRAARYKKTVQRLDRAVVRQEDMEGDAPRKRPPQGKRLRREGRIVAATAEVAKGMGRGVSATQKVQAAWEIIRTMVTEAQGARLERVKACCSAREYLALARLIRHPEWKQEASRIIDEALAGTLKKEESAVATVKRLTRRNGSEGDRTISNELASIARRLSKIEGEVRERGQADAGHDVKMAVSLLEDAVRTLRGE